MLVVSMQAIALNDAEEMEFVGAVNDGDIKIVKRYVETMNVNLEDSYFAWTPFLMSAAKNQMEVMKFLKENGANMNYTHPVTRFNALHHAAEVNTRTAPSRGRVVQLHISPLVVRHSAVALFELACEHQRPELLDAKVELAHFCVHPFPIVVRSLCTSHC